MAETVGEEEIVEGRKRANTDKDAHPTKRAQLGGCRNLDKGGGGGGEEREEEDLKEKVDRLHGLLEDNPKKLGNKDVEDVIRYLDVNDIISLALKLDEGKESEQCWVAEVENWMEEEGEGDCEKVVADIARTMLCRIGIVRRGDIKLLYEKLSPKTFTTLLVAAVNSDKFRHSGTDVDVALIKADDHGIIHKLCCVLPWKLFAHVVIKKRWVTQLRYESDEEEVEEECTSVQKEAAEKCDICFGKARHTGSSGSFCTLKDAIPVGTTVGRNYWIVCNNCEYRGCTNTFEGCFNCGYEFAKAVPPCSIPLDKW